jgi:hypothetical protein
MISATDGATSGVMVGTAPKLGSYPYSALNGEQPRAECKEELYQISAKESQDFQDFGESWTTHLKYISKH